MSKDIKVGLSPDAIAILGICILAAILLCLVWYAREREYSVFRKEAIMRGFAEYSQKSDGALYFKWREIEDVRKTNPDFAAASRQDPSKQEDAQR